MLLQLYRKTYQVKTVVFTDSPSISNYVKNLGLFTLPVPKRNSYGIPVLKWMLISARSSFPSKQYIFINSDILINPFIFEVSSQLHSQFSGKNVPSSSSPHS